MLFPVLYISHAERITLCIALDVNYLLAFCGMQDTSLSEYSGSNWNKELVQSEGATSK